MMSVRGFKVNLLDLCRLCLETGRHLMPIFKTSVTSENDLLAQKISTCLPVQISSADSVSQKICDVCLGKVDSFYDFWHTTGESQKKLMQWLRESEEEEIQNKISSELDPLGINSLLPSDNGKVNVKTLEMPTIFPRNDPVLTHIVVPDVPKTNDITDISCAYVDSSLNPEEPGPSGLQNKVHEPESSEENKQDCFGTPSPPKEEVEGKKCESSKQPLKRFGRKPIGPDLISHMLDPKAQKYICEICFYSCPLKGNFKKHVMRHVKQYRAQCKECQRGFYSLAAYREHMADGICPQNSSQKCTLCNRKYQTSRKLEEHMKSHLPGFVPSGYQCETCGKTFITRRGMEKHREVIHKGVKHKCYICCKEVSCAQSLKNHMKIHTGERSYVCFTCGKAFISVNSLKVHERTHTGEKPYSCNICQKSFTQHSTLTVHKRYHTGERPYDCSYCTKRFVTKTTLKAHEKVHEETSASF